MRNRRRQRVRRGPIVDMICAFFRQPDGSWDPGTFSHSIAWRLWGPHWPLLTGLDHRDRRHA